MGSGSLLLNAKKYSGDPEYIKYYGQELNTSTYNLARMNMFLHGVKAENQNLRNGDTLDADWPTDEDTDFNMVLMNPPYSAKWSASSGFLQDERFSDYGVLAPKSKADYAFLLHGLYHLKNNGTMAIVLPHGVLFRGAAEGKIREKLLRAGNIYAVIGLPANLFYNTSIPTCIIVLKKHRDGRDVLFIDASKKFNKGKKQNEMTDEHIEEVLDLYTKRETVEKESYLATFEDIEKNDFNLNIPRYVDNFEKEEEVDLNALLVDMKKTDEELGQVQGEFRFKGFTDDWEQRKLGDLVDRVTRKNQDLVSELPLTISAQYGLIDQNEFFDKRVASKDVSGYYLIENGEFAYNKSTSTDAPWGAIKRLDRYENGVWDKSKQSYRFRFLGIVLQHKFVA